MKKVVSLLIVLALMFSVSMGSFALSKTEKNLMSPYYGYYIVTKDPINFEYFPSTPVGYIFNEKGLTLVEPQFNVVEKNGVYTLEKSLSKRLVLHTESAKKGKSAITVSFTTGEAESDSLKVTFKTKNKVQTMGDVFEDDGASELTKVSVKDDKAYYQAFEKANKSKLDKIYKDLIATKKEYAIRLAENYKKSMTVDEKNFNDMKQGLKVQIGTTDSTYVIIEKQVLTAAVFDYQNDKFDIKTYEIQDMSRTITELSKASNESGPTSESVVTILLKDGGKALIKSTITSDDINEHQVIINDESLGYLPYEQANN